jgi:SecD/SecF fusion protein
MGSRRRNLFILLVVVGLTIASGLAIATKPTVLGLDLRGGTELVYQGRPTPQSPTVGPTEIDRAIEIIRERTDKLGVSEPEIARIGQDEIDVGLPNVQNAQRAIQQIGTTAQLELYDFERNVIAPPHSNAPKKPVASPDPQPSVYEFPNLYEAVKFAGTQKPSCPHNECTTSGPTLYLFDKNTHALLGGPAEKKGDLKLQQPNQQFPAGSQVLSVPQGTVVVQSDSVNPTLGESPEQVSSSPHYVLRDRPELNGTDITDPKPEFDPVTNQPNVTFQFTDAGRTAFQDVTRRIANRGRNTAPPGVIGSTAADQYSQHFAIVLDNKVFSAPIINFEDNPTGIDGRTGAQISGNFTIGTSQDLAQILQIGALPINLTLISQSTVSATLGQQALDQGLKAGIIGLALILIFLVVFYRLLGVVAVVGLVVYAIYFFGLIKLIPITLTLPGIAGLVLTIGVAADANIVIFERIKEEARAGRSTPSAIAQGYKRGIATIVDANVITLITAFILFVLATAGVKGFAFTLGVGTVVSLFTAVLFTQAFLGLFGRSRLFRSPRALGAGAQRVRWHFDFTGASKWFFSMSGTILAIGAISLAVNQLNLGIDFQSGARIQTGLVKPATVDQVRTALEDANVPNAGSAEIQSVSNDQLGQNAFEIKGKFTSEDVNGPLKRALDQGFGLRGGDQGFNTDVVGPTFGKQVERSALIAIIFSLLVISAYVAIRFEAKYAIPVIIALFHDVLITTGVYSLTGRELTSGTVAAFLTILGYSMYDTVIVFDRVRENVPRMPRAAFSQIVNKSMSEVLTRSLITGLSTVFLITVLYVFGGSTLQDFAFAMGIGVLSGAYSSIFIASPVLTHWKEREPAYRSRRARLIEEMGYVPMFPEENVVAKTEIKPGERAAAPATRRLEPRPGELEPGEMPPSAGPAAPAGGRDGGDGVAAGDGAAVPSEPVGAGPPDDQRPARSERQRKRRQQQRRRRKHGRNR